MRFITHTKVPVLLSTEGSDRCQQQLLAGLCLCPRRFWLRKQVAHMS
jgi:hypothetical protein